MHVFLGSQIQLGFFAREAAHGLAYTVPETKILAFSSQVARWVAAKNTVEAHEARS
jgi:hypothetical protein